MKAHPFLAALLFLFQSVSGAIQNPPPLHPRDTDEPLKVACVGDSITQGSGADRGQSYPDQLQELLGGDWKVGNFGVSGRTLLRAGDHPYWNEGAYKKAMDFAPDVVIIMLGTNDTKPHNWQHREDFEGDYRDLVRSFQALRPSPRVYVCRPVPVPDPGNFGINEAGIQEQIPILDNIAADLKTGIIDMHAALEGKPELLPDRVHPNTAGAGEMAKAAAFVLTGLDPASVTRVNSLFGNGAILQRGMEIPVWGTAPTGTKITVQFGDQNLTSTASDGKWKVVLKRMAANAEPRNMTITGTTKIIRENLMVGDVWLASGQSNMERQLGPRPPQKEIVGWKEAAAAADFPLIRECYIPLSFSAEPVADARGQWRVCTPETAPNFSAVGFFFARELQPHIKVPLGIIHSSWGGTRVEAWTSPDTLRELRIDSSKTKDQNSPAALYHAMIAPLVPFPVRGVIWYQGESNNGNAIEYRDRFPALIEDWRNLWNTPKLPFLFVQIAPFKGMGPEIREAQFLTLAKSPHTAMVVTTDVGDADDIHPADKGPVGSRLALAARAVAYGESMEYSGPLYESMKVAGNRLAVKFSHVGKGLEAKDGELKGFMIAGEDNNFVPATAEIRGDNVILSSDQVSQPKAARYGWANVPECNLFNKDGLPASPFRTDVN